MNGTPRDNSVFVHSSGSGSVTLNHAVQAHALGEIQTAFDGYEKVLTADPDCALALVGMSRIFHDNNRADMVGGLRARALASPALDGLSAIALARDFAAEGEGAKALDAVRIATKRGPNSAVAQSILGCLSFATGLVYEAHRAYVAAVRLAPNNVQYLDELANQCLSEHFFALTGIKAVQAAMAKAGSTVDRRRLLGRLYCCDQNFTAAAEVLGALHSEGALDAELLVQLAVAYRHIDDVAGIQRVAADLGAARAAQQSNDSQAGERLAAYEARVLLLQGDIAAARSLFRAVAATTQLDFSDPAYLPKTPQRLERLRSLVGGRDVAILAHGPSIAELESHTAQIASSDLCYFGLNRFQVTERHLLEPAGRQLDLVAVTPPQLMNDIAPHITEFLTRPDANVLVSLRSSLDALPGGGAARESLEARYDDKLLYVDSRHPGGASPRFPLHFIPANTLTILLGLAVLGGAKRIFVFGADGAVAHDLPENSHYKKGSAGFVFDLPDGFDAHYPAAIAADTEQFNDVWEANLHALCALYDLPLPPMFNVNPASAVAVAPRISYKQAFHLLA
jgi:tetratricopeptide (TPR) repeat protein